MHWKFRFFKEGRAAGKSSNLWCNIRKIKKLRILHVLSSCLKAMCLLFCPKILSGCRNWIESYDVLKKDMQLGENVNFWCNINKSTKNAYLENLRQVLTVSSTTGLL